MFSTITAPPKIDRLRDGETRIVMENIDWATYESLVNRLDEQHVRLTYDRGTLELMTRSMRHEQYNIFSGRFVDELSMELDDVPTVRAYGGTTWKRAPLDRALEADQCYYFDPAKLAILAGRDPDRPEDPLPDLMVDIEISRSAIDRMGVYAAFGVAEIWRCDGEIASFQQLGSDGVYRPIDRSRFLAVTSEDWLQWLHDAEGAGMKAWTRRLRGWIHDELLHRP